MNSQISIYIIILILQICTYMYLRNLNTCVCVQGLSQDVQERDKSNIKHLEYIFLFFIIMTLVNLLFITKPDLSKNKMLASFSLIYMVILIMVYVVLIVNTLRLYKNMPSDCDCARKWPRFYLYLTSFIAAIIMFNVIMFVLTMVFGFIMSKFL